MSGTSCSCDADCADESDCCFDFQDTCNNCAALGCGEDGLSCSCDDDCMDEQNCCGDYVATCQDSCAAMGCNHAGASCSCAMDCNATSTCCRTPAPSPHAPPLRPLSLTESPPRGSRRRLHGHLRGGALLGDRLRQRGAECLLVRRRLQL